jgi:DNA gyrase subunit A
MSGNGDNGGGDSGRRFANEKIVDQDIEHELKTSYLTYAMSVIISRALPDVRDGLKPSQRRILLAMNDLNLSAGAKYKKCAKIVGECMGKYHPHGDAAIYPTLVRMAQDFSIRYPLIDGQGNFGSIDGDPPAAMRYTEARMTRAAMDLLEDLDKDTVIIVKNFDESEDEPTLLPGRFPNLLCNGSTGIAVGMATSIPPHNVREVCDALVALIRDPSIGLDVLLEHIKGPDFPTGATICGRSGFIQAYKTGRGLITVRSKYHVETGQGKKRDAIVVTEIPYQESKETIINRIVECVEAEKVTGIADVRDESDKDGIRLVIEIKRDADPEVVVNQLFKHSSLQTSFSIINIALVDGRPETLTLKEMLTEYKKHRVVIIRRRTAHLLKRAEHRLHIVQGLLRALDLIDAIIQCIRSSATPEEAHQSLMRQFEFSDLQAREILQMRLQRLTGLERDKLEEERKELAAKIDDFKDILANEQRVLQIVIDDLNEIKERFGDARRTEIEEGEATEIVDEDLIAVEDVVVTISRESYIKRTPLNLYRSQSRGGKGKSGGQTKEGDDIKDLFVASTHDYILFFTNLGRVYWLKVYHLPDLPRTSRGRAIVNLLKLNEGEEITQQIRVREFRADEYILMATRGGVIKKSELSLYSRPRDAGIIALQLDEGDKLISVALCRDGQHVVIGTSSGMAIRFPEGDVRSVGRTARGVRGIVLRDDDHVVDMVVVNPPGQGEEMQGLLTVCENGFGKRSPLSEYRIQGRGGYGIIDIRTSERNGRVIGMKVVEEKDDIVLMTSGGQIIRMAVESMRPIGRNTQGVRLITLGAEDRVVGVEKVVQQNPNGNLEVGESQSDAAASPPSDSSNAGGAPPAGESPT